MTVNTIQRNKCAFYLAKKAFQITRECGVTYKKSFSSFCSPPLDSWPSIWLFLRDWGLWPLQLTFIAEMNSSFCDTLILINTGPSRRTCTVTGNARLQMMRRLQTATQHADIDVYLKFMLLCWEQSGLNAFIFLSKVVLLCLLPGNHSCSPQIALPTFSNRWKPSEVVSKAGCLWCSLGIPEWARFLLPYLFWLISPPDVIGLDGNPTVA